MVVRRWFDNHASAFCYAHDALERGDIILKVGKEAVDGVERFRVDEYV